MKKTIIIILFLTLVSTFGLAMLTGCKEQPQEENIQKATTVRVRDFDSFEEISYGAEYSEYFGKATLNTDKRYIKSGSGSVELRPTGSPNWNYAGYAYQQQAKKPYFSIYSNVATREKYDISKNEIYPLTFNGSFYNASGVAKQVYIEIVYLTDKGLISGKIIKESDNPEIIAKDALEPIVLESGKWQAVSYDCTRDISDLWSSGYDVIKLHNISFYFDIQREEDNQTVIYADEFTLDVYNGKKPEKCSLPDQVDRGQTVTLPQNGANAYEVYLNGKRKVNIANGSFTAAAESGDYYEIVSIYDNGGNKLELKKTIPVRYEDELQNFESIQSVYGLMPNGAGVIDNYSRYTSMVELNRNPDYVISGRSSLKITAPYYDYKDSWPFIGFEQLQKADVSKYYSVSMWIYNDDSMPVSLKLLDYYGFTLQPYAWNKVELTTAQIGAINGKNVAENKDVTVNDICGLNMVYTLGSSQSIRLYVDAIKVNASPDGTKISLKDDNKKVSVGEEITPVKAQVSGAADDSTTKITVTDPDGLKEKLDGGFYCRKTGRYYVDYLATDRCGNGTSARFFVDSEAKISDVTAKLGSPDVDLSLDFAKIDNFAYKLTLCDGNGNDCSNLLSGKSFKCSQAGVYIAKYTISGSNIDDLTISRLIVVYENGSETGFDFEDGKVPQGFIVTDYNSDKASANAEIYVSNEKADYSDLSLKIDCKSSSNANLLITSASFLKQLKECKYFTFRIYSSSRFTLKCKDQKAYYDTDVCDIDANCWVKVTITKDFVVRAFNTIYSDGSVKTINDVRYLKLYGFNSVYIDNIRFYK